MSGMFSKVSGAFSHKEPEEKANQGDQEGDSLLTILPHDEDRGALTLLIADCTERMRKGIVDIFDPNQTGKDDEMVLKKLEGLALHGEEANAEADAKLAEAEEAKQRAGSEDEAKKGEKELEKRGKEIQKDAQNDEKEAAKLEKDFQKRDKELSGPKMQELKTEALKFFDDWRDQVITRVGEVVNSKEKARSQEKNAQGKVDEERPPLPARPAKMPEYDQAVFETTNRLYPPIDTSLKDLPKEKRMLILHACLLLMLSLEHYQSHSRILLLRLCNSLDLEVSILTQDEAKVAQGLLAAAENMNADEETKKKAEQGSTKRKWTVGLAAVGGAALIGITGGLAAPLLAAGVGTVMGGLGLGATATAGYLGAIAGSSVLVGGLFGAYGGRMTGKMMDQYARQVEDFAFIPVRTPHLRESKNALETRRLRVGIGISGWLTSKTEVIEPWKVLGSDLEDFALRWELEALLNLGNSLTTMVKSAAWSVAKSEIIKRTVFGALTAGLWPLALLKVGRVIDNPWSVASYRAQKAGEVLAEALISKVQGERPVTLVGYSLGAKVIYTCLHRLAERRAFGLVESAVLIGSPVPSDAADWRLLRTVVSGRLVNVYSTKDYILAFLYRSSNFQYGVAGLQRIENVAGVENVDVSEHVEGHTSYRLLNGTILKQIGFEDLDVDEVVREERARQQQEEKEEEERKAAEAQGESTEEGLEREVEERNQKSFGGWTKDKLSRVKGSWEGKKEEKRERREVERKVDEHGKAQGTKEQWKDLGGEAGGYVSSAALP
ncbi:hypothetical protein MBLNU230_g8492t1 [Neophaeotheca triangularis]